MYENFTERSRKVMALANQEAQRLNHEHIGTEHVLLGLIKEGSGVGANVLKNMGLELPQVRREVERLVKPGQAIVTVGRPLHTPLTKKVIEYALDEARKLNHSHVGTEHLLLGLLRVNEGKAVEVLMGLGIKLEEVRQEVLNLLGPSESPAPKPPAETEPNQRIIIIESADNALDNMHQELVDKKLKELGAEWRVVSANTSVALSPMKRILVTTILMEKKNS